MTKSRGVLLVLILAGALWAISLASWQAGVAGDTLGPAGVADVTEDASSQASPVATACVAIIAVTGLLSAMLGKIGRFVVLGFAGLAAVGYGMTALQSVSAPELPRGRSWACARQPSRSSSSSTSPSPRRAGRTRTGTPGRQRPEVKSSTRPRPGTHFPAETIPTPPLVGPTMNRNDLVTGSVSRPNSKRVTMDATSFHACHACISKEHHVANRRS